MAGSFGTFQTAVGRRLQGQAMATRRSGNNFIAAGSGALAGGIVFGVAAGGPAGVIGASLLAVGSTKRSLARSLGARARALDHLITRARIAKGAAIRAYADGAGAVGHYSRNAAAAGNLGDGMTDSYTRMSASGNAVQVAAYTTPKR